ncbi:WD40 repeat [Nocardia amikacinitolerans]|uniref:WD40 repeat n=1 Tax=Nocardia amikacinitolerans TaxID=756689 RepID=A0A285LUI1_9NOCA|nr:TIR domain-containing protein [Nocardia amikacinitolerans]MCP2300092.1 WD40 repeat [Nocardia amikacinitolerans]SNY88545.1 WD40 repeat [Nocardia amikacinitolerans]
MARIFLSHSSRDDRAAIALKQWLVEQDRALAEEIFLDLDRTTGIRPGVRWKDALVRAAERCEAVICLLSTNWERSAECKTEFRTAENLHKPIYCLRLEKLTSREPAAEWQQVDLFGAGPHTAIVIDDGPPVELLTEGLRRLWDALRASGIGAEHFPWPPPGEPNRAPYRGWEPFDAVDAAVYFGRDGQIVRALDAMRGMRSIGLERLFVILGPSGCGKSSFLRAGLVPRLVRDDRHFVVLDTVRPERAAVTGPLGLARSLHASRARLRLGGPPLGAIKSACLSNIDDVRELFVQLRKAAERRLLDDAAPPTIVLPIDQGEELFNPDAGREAEQLLRIIARLTEDSAVDLLVVMAIRADRYEPLQTSPTLDSVSRVVFDELRPLGPAQFADVIRGPAARASEGGTPLRVQPELVERLVDECASSADPLPLLSLTMSRLFTDYGSSGALTVRDYESMGGMRHVVESEIAAVLSGDPAERARQLESLRHAFVPWLATINPDTDQPLRRVARWSDLPEDSRALIDDLVARRLLVKDERDGETVVEVALESLFREWGALAGWLTEERANLRSADALDRAAAAWQDNDRDEAWLIEGTRLTDAEQLIADPRYRQRLSGTTEFVRASRQRADDRAELERQRQAAELETAMAHAAVLRKRSRILRAVLAVTVVIAVVAVYGLVRARSEEKEAQARFREATAARLATNAQSALSGARPADDVRTIQETLAAHHLSATDGPDVLLRTLTHTAGVQKVVKTGLPFSIRLYDTAEEVGHHYRTARPDFAVAFSPDNRHILTGGMELRLWDADTGAQVDRSFESFRGALRVAFSPDGRRIAAVAADYTVQLWEADSGRLLGEFPGHTSTIYAIAFGPDGRLLASADDSGTIRLWDTESRRGHGEPLTGHTGTVNGLAFSPDGRRLVSAGKDTTLQVWNVDSGQPVAKLERHAQSVQAVAWSRDGQRIVSGSTGLPPAAGVTEDLSSGLLLWNAETLAPIGGPLQGHEGMITSVAFSPDSRRVVSAATDATLRLWDAETGKESGAPLTGHTAQIMGVAFSPDGTRLASTSHDGTLRVWNADPRRSVGHKWQSGAPGPGYGPILAFQDEGRRLVKGDNADGTIWILDLDTRRYIGPIADYPGGPVVASFSPDGQKIALAGPEKTIEILNADGQPSGPTLTGFDSPATLLEFSEDNRLLVAATGESIRLWDTVTGQPIGEPLTGIGVVNAVAISPDGERIAAGGGDKSVRIWDMDSGAPIGGALTGHSLEVSSVWFSPDGAAVLSYSPDSVHLWDAGTGAAVREPHKANFIDTLAVSPNGDFYVTAENLVLHRWDLRTGKPIGGPMTGHGSLMVRTISVSSDSRYIISGGSDSTLRFWDAATGDPIGDALTGPDGWIMNAYITSDNRRVRTVFVGYDQSSGIWEWPGPDSWARELCAKLTFNMSREQWDEWVSPDIPYRKTCEDLPELPDDQ